MIKFLIKIFSNLISYCFVENLLEENKFNGFPVVVNKESQILSGFVTRRDLKVALRKFLIHGCFDSLYYILYYYFLIPYICKRIIQNRISVI